MIVRSLLIVVSPYVDSDGMMIYKHTYTHTHTHTHIYTYTHTHTHTHTRKDGHALCVT